MTWKCDRDIFPNETGDRLAKNQAIKWHQDPPWKASLMETKNSTQLDTKLKKIKKDNEKMCEENLQNKAKWKIQRLQWTTHKI